MAKRIYSNPILFDTDTGLNNGGSGTIINIGGSQGTSGYDSMFKFEGIDQATLDMIELNCDDTDLAEMDTNHNLTITKAEFEVWFNTVKGGNW